MPGQRDQKAQPVIRDQQAQQAIQFLDPDDYAHWRPAFEAMINANGSGPNADLYQSVQHLVPNADAILNQMLALDPSTIILPTDSDFLQFLQSEGKAKAVTKPAAAAPKPADSGGAEKKTP